jgi:D-amino-acid dehydrogenase
MIKKMKNMNKHEITVIGSGIIGICCALKLQSEGHKVLLLDKNEPVSGCSKGNAGHFATEQIFPMANKEIIKQLPKILFNPKGPLTIKRNYIHKITPWMIRFLMATRNKVINKGTQALRNLNENAMSAYKPLLKLADVDDLIENKGYLLAFEGPQAHNLANKESNTLKPFEINNQVLNCEEINELEPLLNGCDAAVYFPDISHSIDPYKLAIGLFDSFISLGGEFKKNEIKDLIMNPDKSVNLICEENTMHTDKVVIAAGAFSQKLVAKLGIKAPLDTERGYHLMVDKFDLLNRPVAFAQRKFIITPMSTGTRLAGTVEFAGLKNKPNWDRAEMLLDHALHFLDPLKSIKKQDCQKWMGFRPSFPDSLPVIDRCQTNHNIFFCFGHQHLGLTQAGISAELVSDLINERDTQFDISPYSIRRF